MSERFTQDELRLIYLCVRHCSKGTHTSIIPNNPHHSDGAVGLNLADKIYSKLGKRQRERLPYKTGET